MIPKEQLGYDTYPDLLTVVFSSMDYERYSFGPSSVEMEDIYLRMDKDIAELLKYLEDGYGTQNILVYLTGLTSISYSSDYLKEKIRMSAGNFNPESSVALLKSNLNIKYGQGEWIELFSNQNVYLNHDLIEKKKIDLHAIQREVASFLSEFEGIAFAKPAYEIEADNFLGGGPLEAFQNNYYPKRSGDVLIKYEEGWTPKDKFAPIDYTENNQVSLVWYGGGIRKGTTFNRTNATDICTNYRCPPWNNAPKFKHWQSYRRIDPALIVSNRLNVLDGIFLIFSPYHPRCVGKWLNFGVRGEDDSAF